MRLASITTMLPSSMGSLMAARLETRSWSCSKGFLGPRRNRMTEGFFSSRSAKMLPKSVSAEIPRLLPERKSPGPAPPACHNRAREPYHVQRSEDPRRPRETRHCPQEISRTTGNGEFAFADCLCGVS